MHRYRRKAPTRALYILTMLRQAGQNQRLFRRQLRTTTLHSGAPANRGTAAVVQGIDSAIDRCRLKLSQFVHAKSALEIAFAFNGTDALNMAIQGVLQNGDHVVTTNLEHNSVLRPLNELMKRRDVRVSFAEADSNGIVSPEAVSNLVEPETRLICVTHVSNVTGVIQPIEQIGAKLRQFATSKPFFLVDAAQSLGHIPVDVQQLGCDLLAGPGHKGLLGPLGTGFLFVRSEIAEHVQPIRFGGTGTKSESESQPMEMPGKLESGNLNVGGIVGLEAGVDFVSGEVG